MKYCPSCGEKLVDNAKFCKSCGTKLDMGNADTNSNFRPEDIEFPEKDYRFAIIVGYIFSILISLIGLIIAIYLLTRKDSPKASRHGKIILVISILLMVFSFLINSIYLGV